MQPSRQKDANAYLTCFLCEQSCVKPRLCPKCSKAFCQHCLLSTSTSSRSQCPSCSARLRVEDFLSTEVVIGFVEQVITRVKRQVRRNQQRQLCIQHDMTLSYFCIECNQPLCSDCGMLTNKHIGHKFVSYRDIYQKVKRRVLDQFPRFDKKIKLLEDKKTSLRNKLAKLTEQYRKDKYFFQEGCFSYSERIDSIYKARQEAVISKEEINNARLQQLEILRDTIYEQMETKTHLSLIRQTDSLAESINALSSQQPPPLVPEPIIEADDMSQLVPDYTTWKYTLTQFSTRSGIVYSEGKLVNGVQWRLKIYPKGNGLARQKYLSLFVEMSKGFTGQNKYQYRIQLINPGNSFLTVRREYCSTFQIGECWGYNQFEPLQNLVAKEYLCNDQLVFQIGIRNRTYRALVKQQNQYIAILTKQIADKTKIEMEGMPKRGRTKEIRKLTNMTKSPQREKKQQQKKEISFENSTLDRIKDYLLKQSKQN